jgi:UDP-N-acetylmuramyl pentapeptide phosphotransferase/UDP-N-acetylglucosamine-1-phosphate transferase
MLIIVLLAVCVSLVLSAVMVLTKHWHGRFTIDSTFGIQKFHTCPTPRIGGLGIYIALCSAALLLEGDLKTLLSNILLAGLPAFAIGLLEDVTKRIGVKTRLLVTAISGALAVYLTSYSIGRLGFGGWEVDLLAWGPMALIFTAFAVCGLSNAVNIIDGFNGLASGTVILMLLGLGFIAYSVGDLPLFQLSLIGVAAVFGFMVINFPLGKLFLGDGGAYFVGFYVAWLAVMLIARNPDVSPFAALLVLAYPVL